MINLNIDVNSNICGDFVVISDENYDPTPIERDGAPCTDNLGMDKVASSALQEYVERTKIDDNEPILILGSDFKWLVNVLEQQYRDLQTQLYEVKK